MFVVVCGGEWRRKETFSLMTHFVLCCAHILCQYKYTDFINLRSHINITQAKYARCWIKFSGQNLFRIYIKIFVIIYNLYNLYMLLKNNLSSHLPKFERVTIHQIILWPSFCSSREVFCTLPYISFKKSVFMRKNKW